LNNPVKIASYEEVPDIARALNSPLRRRILSLLYHNEMNIQLIAEHLGIPQSTCTVNIQALEKAGLIDTRIIAASKGSQKICVAVCEEVVIPLQELENPIGDNEFKVEMPIGLFSDYNISPPCGLLSEEGIIGYFDHVESFLNPQRAKAQLIWFSEGYVEYPFPIHVPIGRKIKVIAITAEVCSEYPGANSIWPSDITLWINGHEIGTWTSPGDMGDPHGRLTPSWWGEGNTQFGFLKTWKITRECSFIDGVEKSRINLDDLAIPHDGRLMIRLGNGPNAVNRGGLNLFGHKFGNYKNDLTMQVELEPERNED
jgi:predicted transcriptional regulator